MSLGPTSHVKFHIDPEGQLHIYDSNTGEKQLIQMRRNADGSKTSRSSASEIEDVSFNFRYDHKDTKKGDLPAEIDAEVDATLPS